MVRPEGLLSLYADSKTGANINLDNQIPNPQIESKTYHLPVKSARALGANDVVENRSHTICVCHECVSLQDGCDVLRIGPAFGGKSHSQCCADTFSGLGKDEGNIRGLKLTQGPSPPFQPAAALSTSAPVSASAIGSACVDSSARL